jgi:hypothetical protein
MNQGRTLKFAPVGVVEKGRALLWESLKKAVQSNGLPTEFVKRCEIVADRNQWRAVLRF